MRWVMIGKTLITCKMLARLVNLHFAIVDSTSLTLVSILLLVFLTHYFIDIVIVVGFAVCSLTFA